MLLVGIYLILLLAASTNVVRLFELLHTLSAVGQVPNANREIMYK